MWSTDLGLTDWRGVIEYTLDNLLESHLLEHRFVDETVPYESMDALEIIVEGGADFQRRRSSVLGAHRGRLRLLYGRAQNQMYAGGRSKRIPADGVVRVQVQLTLGTKHGSEATEEIG